MSITTAANPSVDPLELAEFVITWSGFAIAFITVVGSILAAFGIKEVKDLHETKVKIEELKKAIEASQINIKKLEESTRETLQQLTENYKSNAQRIMFGTYYYSLGMDSYDHSGYIDAIKYFKLSLDFVENNTEAICMMGRAYTFIDNKTEALKCYKRALYIDENCAEVYRALAALFRYTNRQSSLDYARKAVEISPENTEYMNYYSLILRDNDNLSEALRILVKSYSIQQHPDTSFLLSILYIAENSLGRARAHILEAIEGYNNVVEYASCKPIWKAMAEWIHIIIENERPERFEKALEQLKQVRLSTDSSKTKTVVVDHIRFVLKSLKVDSTYAEQCEVIFNDLFR